MICLLLSQNISTARNNPAIDKSIHVKMCGKCRVDETGAGLMGEEITDAKAITDVNIYTIYIYVYL